MTRRIPFLLIGIAAASVSIVTVYHRLSNERSESIMARASALEIPDDPFVPEPRDNHSNPSPPAPIKIQSKFVHVGSGSEELSFDWIVPAAAEN